MDNIIDPSLTIEPAQTQSIKNDVPGSIITVNKIRFFKSGQQQSKQVKIDTVSVEEPLQIILLWLDVNGKQIEKEFTVTMRTPGHDRQLAIGLLKNEGIIRTCEDIIYAQHIVEEERLFPNILEIKLAAGIKPEMQLHQRHMAVQSSCGICGKTTLKALELKSPPKITTCSHWLDIETVLLLSDYMRKQQTQFLQTGGVHAVALFDHHGNLIRLREDVGRHNAMDKLIGATMQDTKKQPTGCNPDPRCIVVLSGRISYELVQKAIMAQFPVIVAVGAPSSLAISVAQRFNITLIGFVSNKGFNVYHGAFRLNE